MSELRKNLPQSWTLWPATCVLVTGGMNIAWSLGFNAGLVLSNHLRYCWFIGGIIGALVIPFVIKKVAVKWLLFSAAVLVLIGGIIYACGTDNADTIIAARYLNGFAFGWTFVVSLSVGGEQIVKSLRGRYLSIEAIGINLGIFGQIVCVFNDEDTGALVHTILIMVCGAMGIVLSILVVLESPFYFLLRNDENRALECLVRLQVPHVATEETYALLEENKRFISEQRLKTQPEILRESLIALAKVGLHRCFVALSFTLPLNATLYTAVLIGPRVMWPLTFYSLLRLIGSFVFCCCTQNFGRKRPVLFSLPVCAGMLIGVGCIFSSDDPLYIIDNVVTVIALLLIYQFFAGVYMGPSGSQISEAFPLEHKQLFIAAVVIIEMLLQIITVVAAMEAAVFQMADFCFALAALTSVYIGFFYFFMPETNQTTLREAQAKFKTMLTPGFN